MSFVRRILRIAKQPGASGEAYTKSPICKQRRVGHYQRAVMVRMPDKDSVLNFVKFQQRCETHGYRCRFQYQKRDATS